MLRHQSFCRGLSPKNRPRRILGTVWLGGRNINLQMVSEGYAWAYHYNKDPQYNDAQNAAKARRLGLWAGAAQDPWAYRRGQQGRKRAFQHRR
ncbi:MAG: thermonuclease family protein [Kiritimatiellae bacterium]|nr:thermonuclease family protein [Kiritimatiellia bacterium]